MNDSSENKMKTTVPSGDPVLDQHQYGTWMTIPYVFKNISRGERNSFYQAVQEFSMPEDSGFKCNAPEAQLRREQLDRWLLKEPRALFRQDEDDIFQETPYNSPRMKWISWNKSEWQFPNESTEHGFRLAMLNSKQKSMRPFPNEMQFDAFSLLSNEGVLLLVIRILPPKEGGISLQKAMDLNYDLAHSGNFGNIPVLVPNKLFDRSINEQLGETGECLFSDRQVSQCLKLWPHEKHGQDPLLEINESDNEISWGKKGDAQPVILQSFPELMKQKIVDALSKEYGKSLQTYQASRGRTNLQGEEFKTIHVTGDHRVHLSCESILSFGQDLTDYPQDWKSRWGTDYFLCFLIAYHQSILCQELSWSSFKKSSERDLGELNERFINYCTYYDFSLISSQLNHQKIYRVAREVLGVPGITGEVGEEIKARLDTQRNEQQQRFNESQANFNSLAVLFFLLGCTTFLLNLNLKPFSSDAEITWDFLRVWNLFCYGYLLV